MDPEPYRFSTKLEIFIFWLGFSKISQSAMINSTFSIIYIQKSANIHFPTTEAEISIDTFENE